MMMIIIIIQSQEHLLLPSSSSYSDPTPKPGSHFFLAVMASYCKPLLVKSHFFGSWSPNFPCFNLPFCWWKLPCLLLPPGPNCGNPLQVSSLKSAERLELLSELQCLAKLRHPHLCGSLGSSLVFRSGNKQSLGNLRSKKGNWDWIRNWIWNSSPAGFNK